MNELDNFKSKLTYEKKPLYGAIGFIVIAVFVALGYMYSDWLRFVLIALPAAFLIIPREKLRYNTTLAIVCAIITIISAGYSIWAFSNILMHQGSSMYTYFTFDWSFYVAHICTILINLYLLFCAFLLYIPTYKGNDGNAVNTVNAVGMNAVSNDQFCRECGAKVNGNLAFCPECGKKL